MSFVVIFVHIRHSYSWVDVHIHPTNTAILRGEHKGPFLEIQILDPNELVSLISLGKICVFFVVFL